MSGILCADPVVKEAAALEALKRQGQTVDIEHHSKNLMALAEALIQQ
jgi:hypothetical protein